MVQMSMIHVYKWYKNVTVSVLYIAQRKELGEPSIYLTSVLTSPLNTCGFKKYIFGNTLMKYVDFLKITFNFYQTDFVNQTKISSCQMISAHHFSHMTFFVININIFLC